MIRPKSSEVRRLPTTACAGHPVKPTFVVTKKLDPCGFDNVARNLFAW